MPADWREWLQLLLLIINAILTWRVPAVVQRMNGPISGSRK